MANIQDKDAPLYKIRVHLRSTASPLEKSQNWLKGRIHPHLIFFVIILFLTIFAFLRLRNGR